MTWANNGGAAPFVVHSGVGFAGYLFQVQQASAPVMLLDVEASAATMRLQPPADAAAINSDGSIFTWLLQPFGEANTSFCDIKLSYDAAGNAVWHFLSDRTGASVASQIFTFELDPRNQSANAEFEVIRGSFRGGAGTRMFHISQGAGIDAIEAGTIQPAAGNLVVGAAAGDVVTHPQAGGALRPFGDGSHDLGQVGFRYQNAFFKGTVRVDTAPGINVNYAATAAGTGGAPTLPANTPTGAAGGAGKWIQQQLQGATCWMLVWQ